MTRFALAIIFFVTIVIALGSAVKAADEPETMEEASSELIILVQGRDNTDGVVKVGNAEVHVFISNYNKYYQQNTNKKGYAVIKGLPRGKVTVKVIAPDWKPFGQVYNLSEGKQEFTVELEKSQ